MPAKTGATEIGIIDVLISVPDKRTKWGLRDRLNTFFETDVASCLLQATLARTHSVEK